MKKRALTVVLSIFLLTSFCLQASAFGQFGGSFNNDRNNGGYIENDGWNRYEGTYEEYRDRNDRWNRDDRQDEPATEETTAAPPPEAISEDGMRLTFADSHADYGYRIVIPADCENEISYAAGTLQSMIVRMTDVLLPIVADSEAPTDREICVGLTNRTQEEPTEIGTNGFLLYTQEERIFILGNGRRGTFNAVCTLLEEQFGCRWFAAGETQIPGHDKLVIPTDLNLHESEYFSYTETAGADINSEHQLYNGLSGGAHHALPADISDFVYLTGCDGTLGKVFVAASDFYETHGDYFALYENKRNAGQLCFSSMGVYAVVLEQVKALLAENRNTDAPSVRICLSLQDNGISCQCSACKAANEGSGTQAAYYTFINRISSALQASGYDTVQIEATAFAGSMQPPAEPLAENVIVRLHADSRCFSHTLSASSCKDNVAFVKTVQAWRDAAAVLYVDFPTANRSYTLGVFPDWQVLSADLQTLYYLGVDGVCASDPVAASECGDEFRAMRMYLYTKLFADPYCSVNTLQAEFLEHWYGENYEAAQQLLELLSENAGDENGHLYLDSSPDKALQLSEKEIEKCDGYWDKIMDGCVDGRHEMHIENSRLAWRYWKAYCGVDEFAADDASHAFRTLVNDLRGAGVLRLNLRQNDFAVGYLSAGRSPQEWVSSNYEVIEPFVKLFLCIGAVLTLGCTAVVFVFALIRRIYFFIFPVWMLVVQCFLLPWHRESYLQAETFGLVLTSLLLIGVAGLLSTFAYYGYHPYEEKRRYASVFLLGAATAGIPYGIFPVLQVLTGFTRAQIFAIGFSVLLLHTSVSAVVLLVRFFRYFPLAPEEEETDAEENTAAEEAPAEENTAAEEAPAEENTAAEDKNRQTV